MNKIIAILTMKAVNDTFPAHFLLPNFSTNYVRSHDSRSKQMADHLGPRPGVPEKAFKRCH